MAEIATAKLFKNGRSQAVRLPRAFRFAGDRVRIRRVGDGVLLEPFASNPREWLAEVDRLMERPFMKGGRKQPATPRRKLFK